MMGEGMIYVDTSVLASYYLGDANDASAGELLARFGQRVCFTWLHRFELRNALVVAVFQKAITSDQSEAIWKLVEQDLKRGLLVNTGVIWNRAFNDADKLSALHGARFGTRGVALLHIAVARLVKARVFVTLDKRQAEGARFKGFDVYP